MTGPTATPIAGGDDSDALLPGIGARASDSPACQRPPDGRPAAAASRSIAIARSVGTARSADAVVAGGSEGRMEIAPSVAEGTVWLGPEEPAGPGAVWL